MLRPKTSYEYLKKKHPASFLFLCQVWIFLCFLNPAVVSECLRPQSGLRWLFHYPCPTEGAQASGDAVLHWLCCSTTALVLRIAKLLQVYLLPPRHQEIGEWWWRLRCRKYISLLCLQHGLVSPQSHPHLPRDIMGQWPPENLPFLLLCFTLEGIAIF